MATRTIQVDYLARVEGEGSLTLRLKNRKVERVEFRIFEPPRFFEAFLRGRARAEVPDITARICGICPVAYQMSSCHALEAVAGVEVGGVLRDLRRLLYCGEWIESHTLHTFMLHAPDFLGYNDAIEMAQKHPEIVKMGLRMKKAGNEIVRLVGGREIHPINVRLGGFYRAPDAAALRALAAELEWCRDTAREALRWMRGLEMPQFERDYTFVALHHELEYPLNEGRIVSNKGLDIPVDDYLEHFREEHVAYSNALHSRLAGREYYTGPLARFNLNYAQLSPLAREAADDAGLVPPVRNPFRSLLVRMVEVVYAFDEALRIIRAYNAPAHPFVELPQRAGAGCGCTEAPRGILFHRYEVDDEGLIVDARIIPPTSQNQLCIEEDLRQMADRLMDLPHADATWLAEQAIRNYDPCLSCSTHFLKLKIERDKAQ